MTTEHNKQIESIPADLQYPCFDKIEHLDPNHSIDILVIFTLLTGLNKLWRLIEKMRKQGKWDANSLLQAVGAIGIILKAIAQMNDGE
jgi:hypothetical protein